MSGDCIFCKIVQGEIPCSKIYADKHVWDFLDINPFSSGHALVIPIGHYARLDECPDDVLLALVKTLKKVAIAVTKAVKTPAYNILSNNGRPAGQLIEHVHFHIIPRQAGDGVIKFSNPVRYPTAQLEELAQTIRKLL
jgi:histidine triad (HIT) family protein